MRTKLAFAVSLLVPFAAAVRAQNAEPAAGLVALHQALLDAGADVVVLNVAAHPDDESSRTDTMLRRKYGMRIVTVYSTYGDGGQNAIGREIGPELAHLRVRETLRASSMSGVEVRWLGMPDFGFSKTLDETLAVWGADRLEKAMREVVDAVDPDVVLTNHSLTQGHGHHRASYWAITEVLRKRAAAGQWTPPLFARTGAEKAQLVFDPSELDEVRGETFARLAHRAWTQHVSQGPWAPHNPLQVGKDFWKLDLPAGGDGKALADVATWSREKPAGAGLPPNAESLPRAELAVVVRERLLAVRAEFAKAKQALDAPGAVRRAQLWQHRAAALERVLLALANVRAEVWLENDEVPRGGTGKAFVVVHGHEKVQKLAVHCGNAVGEPVQAAVRQTPFDGFVATPPGAQAPPPAAGEANAAADAAKPPKQPPPPIPGRFQIAFACDGDPEADGAEPSGPEPSFADVMIEFELDGVPFQIMESRPYDAVPGVELEWDREVLLVPRGKTVERSLTVRVQTHRDYEANSSLRLSMGPGIMATATPGRLGLSKEHAEARVLVRATIDANEVLPDAGIEFGFRRDKVRLPVRVVDVEVPANTRILLVRGPDDTTERVLGDLGVPFDALDRDALAGAKLEDWSAILLDIRAYFHRPELAEMRDRLLQYCRGGGRVVAMYHKPAEWNERAGHPLLAPFPMTIADERVTDENAAVTFLHPEHALLRHPHVLGAADFAGWVQERGLNFPKTWDPAWTPLLSMKDASDEKAHEGALLYTQYGRGDFVYCSLALYRQLRVGNAGAARLLVNLLAR